MLKPKVLSTGFVLMPAIVLLTVYSSVAESTAETCRSSPGSSAPPGLHWYYRVDRTNNRHCWYLHAQGAPVHSSRNLASRNSDAENTADPSEPSLQAGAPGPALQQQDVMSTRLWGSLPEFSSAENSALAFAARWVDLPKSVDLDRRELTALSNGYAAEQPTPKVEDDLPSKELQSTWAGIPAANTGVLPRSSAESSFGSISLAGALLLALVLLSEALVKFLNTITWSLPRLFVRAPSRETGDSGSAAMAASHTSRGPASAVEPAVGLNELRSVLRRADTGLQPPRSFAPSRSTRKQTAAVAAQYFGRIRNQVRAHSAFQRLKTQSFSGPRWAPL
jgi:hypothetical protein